MNFLAHLFLAGDNVDLLIGNFIADGVRGKEIDQYPNTIQKGIILHRQIDSYTDRHPVVKISVNRLRTTNGKYAPVVSDIVFDHFLALHWASYSSELLPHFAKAKYDLLLKNMTYVPIRMHELLSAMISENWLVNYATMERIDITLKNLSQYAHFSNNMANSIEDLKKDYDAYKADFQLFFPDLQAYVINQISLI